jgi:peptidoglycan/xylan/chitin deacetylase (PgdA/CDA1 family)
VHSAQDKLGKAVAITFDDGPGPATRDVLQILKRHGVPATFFQIGRMIEQDPGILRRIRRQGHVLGNHTYSHPVLRGGEKRELSRTQRLIRRKGGFETCLFRAPYGENPPAVVARAGSMGLQTVHWNVDPGDWRGLNARQMVATSLRQTRPGSILVFHDGEDHADMVAGLPRLLESLRQRGYRFLTIPELLRLDIRYR